MREREGGQYQRQMVEHFLPSTEVQERLRRVVSSFNTSPEAIITLLLTEELEFGWRITRRLGSLYETTAMGGFFPNTFRPYSETLQSMGIVAENRSVLDNRGRTMKRFCLTDFGSRYAQPAAAAFVDFELRHRMSLYPVLGQTAKTGQSVERAPLTRTLILLVLQSGERSVRETEKGIGLSQVEWGDVGESLVELARAGVVEFTSLGLQREGIPYRLTGKSKEQLLHGKRSGRGATQSIVSAAIDICEVFRERGGVVTRRMVYDLLPSEIKANRDEEMLLVVINTIFRRLEKEGYLARDQFRGGEKQSWAKLTDRGQTVVNELLLPLVDALSGGPMLQRWREMVLPLVQQSLGTYARETAEFYYPYSKSGRRKVWEWDRNAIRAVLTRLEPDSWGLTAYDVAQRVGIPKKTASRHIKRLFAEGEVHRVRIRGVHYYNLARSFSRQL